MWNCYVGYEGFSGGRQALRGQVIGQVIMCLFGLIGNSFIKIVLWKKGRDKASGKLSLVNMLLFILAVWDNLFLLSLLVEACHTAEFWLFRVKDVRFVWASLGCEIAIF